MDAKELWLKVGIKSHMLTLCWGEYRIEADATLDRRAKEVASFLHRPLPRPPIGSRYYLQKSLKPRSQSVRTGQAIKQAVETSVLAASNNDYLLAYHNITAEAMFSHLQSEGIAISQNTYNTLREGRYWNIGLVIISALALFWGEPLSRFLTQDYAHLKLKPIKSEPPKNLMPRGSINANHLRTIYNLSGNPCL
jgi:hypothetical protein